MARNSSCERQLTRAAGDASFRVLPPMVRLLMHEILAFAACAPEKGRLRFLGSVIASLSRLLSIPETDVETGLETLTKLGWVEQDEETNSLWVAAARVAASRSEAARRNGSNGGRPLKGESTEQYRARKAREREQAYRQGTLIMPIAGGLAETQETQLGTSAESSRAVTTTTSLSLESSGGSTGREETNVGLLCAELAKEARLPEGRKLDPAPVQAWLDAGIAAEAVRRAIRTVASRPKYNPANTMTWDYFTPRLQAEMAQSAAMSPAPSEATVVAKAPPAVSDQERAEQYLAMLAGAVASTPQERESKASYLRNYVPGAWRIVMRSSPTAA